METCQNRIQKYDLNKLIENMDCTWWLEVDEMKNLANEKKNTTSQKSKHYIRDIN